MPTRPRLASPVAGLLALALAACAAEAPLPARPPGAAGTTVPADTNLPPEAFYILPEAAGWDTAALDAFIAYTESQNSTGLIILDRGRIIAERYWPAPHSAAEFSKNFVHGTASNGALIEDVASLQKSIAALLMGIAADKGLVNPDRPVSDYIGPGWSRAGADNEAVITVRHLMEMNSGLTAGLDYEAPAGTRFFYNTPAYAHLLAVLEAVAGQPLPALTEDWLAAPLGLKDTAWRPRPESFGAVGNPLALTATPRDLSRIGQMVLEGGLAPDGRRVISEAQLRAILTPTGTNPAYGRLWWLNGGEWSAGPDAGATRREGPFIPAAPDDLATALGALNRQLFVVPSRGLVIVRTGSAARDADFTQEMWRRLAPALPD
ncbi:MAG: serine hydrolase domain-containing protein [Hyphomonas sp.]